VQVRAENKSKLIDYATIKTAASKSKQVAFCQNRFGLTLSFYRTTWSEPEPLKNNSPVVIHCLQQVIVLRKITPCVYLHCKLQYNIYFYACSK